MYFSAIPNTNKINHRLSQVVPVKWNYMISLHIYQLQCITLFKNMNFLLLMCTNICLASFTIFCRMEMMSVVAIIAICLMRTITSECRNCLCLQPAAHLCTFCGGLCCGGLLFEWMKQVDTHDTHTDAHKCRQPQVGPQCDNHNNLFFFYSRTYFQH